MGAVTGRKKRKLKKRVLRWLMLNLGPVMTYLYTQFVGRTSKWISINNEKHLRMFIRGEPYIACIWHNRALMLPFITKIEGGKNVVVMVSSSDDGVFTSRVLRLFGFQISLGSSTRGGKEAMEKMVATHQNQGVAMAITPDGPLGPNELVKMGAIAMAKETGLPIVSVSYYAKKVTRIKSWDRFILVWPFNTIAAIGSDLRLQVPPDASDQDMEKYRLQLETEMKRISRFVEDYFEGKTSLEGKSYFFSKVSLLRGIPRWTRPNGQPFTKEDLLKES